MQDGRRPDLLERVRVGRELGVLGEQRAELVLDRVVVGVGDARLAAVVRVAQVGDPRGELRDPLAGRHVLRIDRMLPAGSLNQAMSGPSPCEMPFSSCWAPS